MRTSRKTDFRKLKITLVTMTYHNQRPQCPSLSPHVLLMRLNDWTPVEESQPFALDVVASYDSISPELAIVALD